MSQPRFYPLTTEEFLAVNGLLKDSELRVWLYFSTILGNFGTSILEYETEQVAKILNFTQRTVQRAINRLVQLELIDLLVIKGKVSKAKFTPKTSDISLHSGDISRHPNDISLHSGDISRHQVEPNVANNGYKSDGVKVSNSLDYLENLDSLSVYRDEFENEIENTHTEISENSGEELPGNSGQVGQIINVPIVKTESSDLIKCSGGANATIKYDSRLGMRPPAPKPKYLIPDGDWLNSKGQLDVAFIRHTAKQWQKSSNASFHQLAIEEVEALVFSHFAKDHDALAVKWEAFTKTSTRHAEAVKLRLDAGIEISEAEQLEIVGKTQAIASNKSIPLEQLTIGSECEENHQAYKLIESAPIDESEQTENLKRLASLSSVIGRMPEVKANVRRANIRRLETTPADINEANQWILDPSLRMAALQWAKNQGFSFDGSEIYQEEF